MKRCWRGFIFAGLALGFTLQARVQAQPVPADLPNAEQARAAIDQDPAVVQARRAVEAAVHGSAMRAAGPYEWTVGASAQRRRVNSNGSGTEWSAQVERSIRIGGKAALDRDLGEAGLRQARAELGAARQRAARSLLDQWLDWLAARQARVTLAQQLGFAEAGVIAVQTRRRAGDASLLDVNVAQGELAELRRQLSQATAAEAKAQAALRVRYPQLPQVDPALSDPVALELDEAQWRERIVAASARLQAAREALRKAGLTADRAGADRRPDPTVGVYTASEGSGSERVLGLSLSIPLGGRYREQAMLEALRQVDVARAGVDREQRDLEVEVATAVAEASGSLERWRLSEQSAAGAADALRLTQRAYSLGEADLQTLLLVSRQSLAGVSAAAAARADALRTRYRLLVDAGLIWGLADE